MTICYIGIGSNLGNRKKNIDLAVRKVNSLDKIKVVKISSLIETLPVGGPKQDKFLNAAIEIETDLTPKGLLSSLQGIELNLGRVRTLKDGPRTIDLDILLYGDKQINEKGLIIPHPRMKERDFVLIPLKEIAPDIFNKTYEDSQKD